jgi:hypothetical protein
VNDITDILSTEKIGAACDRMMKTDGTDEYQKQH